MLRLRNMLKFMKICIKKFFFALCKPLMASSGNFQAAELGLVKRCHKVFISI